MAGVALSAAASGGCTQAAAPAVPLLGAYFPSWLLCAAAGVLVAILVRVVFVRIGLDDVLPARLAVYLAVAVAAGLLVSALAFGS